MSMATTLLDFILNLLRDSDAKAAFIADPEKALAEAGLSDVCGEDVADAMSYVADYHPVTYVGSREYHGGHTSGPHHGHGGHSYHPEPHATAVHQLEYISNNYSYIDDQDTIIDKSVNQSIWNEGTLLQRFDDDSVIATDQSVAAGRDIDGNVANGDDNVVGDGNNVGNSWYRDDHSINDSFNGNNIADRGGVAGTNNDGNAPNAYNSNVATNDSAVDNSTRDSYNTTVRDSFNDSHDYESNTTVRDSFNDSHDHEESYRTTIDKSYNDHSYDDESFNRYSFNRDSNNRESYNEDSAITRTEQDGVLNLNVSPALNVPIHDNEVEVLD
ncbi:MAG: IniB N-terminal domain-containing protein [Actinomycetota bacterium]|nr:IniB N-terminal domain-containing protein [Actinomycetota bacterium]